MHLVLQNDQTAADDSQQKTPCTSGPPKSWFQTRVRPSFTPLTNCEASLYLSRLWRVGTAENRPRPEPSRKTNTRRPDSDFLSGSRSSNRALMVTKAAGCELQVFKPQQLVNHSTVFFMLFWQETTCDFGATVAGVFSQQRFDFCQDLTIGTASCVFLALYKVAALQQSFNISDF